MPTTTNILNEAKGVFPISEDGEGLQRAIEKTLAKADMHAEDVGMITAHANGTKNSDATEAQVLNKLFGAEAPVTGFKWSTGHSLAAAGILEIALSVKAMQESVVPGIKTLTQLAEECAGINAQKEDQALEKKSALCVTRGFSSQHGCMLLRGI